MRTVDKTIKLWKVGPKKEFVNSAVSSYRANGTLTFPRRVVSPCSSPVRSNGEEVEAPPSPVQATPLHAMAKRTFANAHSYHINSLAMNSDGQTFASADDLRINWWDLERNDTSFSKSKSYCTVFFHYICFLQFILL
jgi:serine/threonine-protein phosphatase 2A regulatory subunit B